MSDAGLNDTPYTHVAQNVDVPTLDPFDAALPRLQAYIQQRGNHYVPKAYWRDRKLGRFVHVLRAKGPDALTPEQQAQLDSIGFTFDFDQNEALWWAHLHTYERYVERYKTSHLPSRTWHAAWHGFRSTFADWYWQQQDLYRNQMLPLHKVQVLRAAGYDVRTQVPGCESMTDQEYAAASTTNSPRHRHFAAMLPKLAAFKAEFGDCLVPRRWYRDPQLGQWVAEMRSTALELLTSEERHALSDLGLPRRIDVHENNWNTVFHELARFHSLFGHVDVPVKWRDEVSVQHGFDLGFSAWVHNQPALYTTALLHPSKVAKLNRLGFDVAARAGMSGESEETYAQRHAAATSRPSDDVRWDFMVGQLEEWKANFLTCLVPRQAFDNPALGEWVHEVRWLKKHGRLPAPKVKQLEAIGLRWRVDTASNNWNTCFHTLRRHKLETGSADLPEGFTDPSNARLTQAARWLDRQRVLYNKQKLDPIKLRLLKDVLEIKLKRPYGPNRVRKRSPITEFAL